MTATVLALTVATVWLAVAGGAVLRRHRPVWLGRSDPGWHARCEVAGHGRRVTVTLAGDRVVLSGLGDGPAEFELLEVGALRGALREAVLTYDELRSDGDGGLAELAGVEWRRASPGGAQW